MLFHSALFIVFLGVLVPVFGLLRDGRSRNALLLAASYLFYANWDVRYLPLLLVSTAVDAAVGRRIHASRSAAQRRGWLLLSLVANLGLLAVFKYGNFVLDNGAGLFAAFGVEAPRLPVEVPIGISFYTFQTMSYSDRRVSRAAQVQGARVDHGRGAVRQRSFRSSIAGPIVRSEQFSSRSWTAPMDGHRLDLDRVEGSAQHRCRAWASSRRSSSRTTMGLIVDNEVYGGTRGAVRH